MADSFLDNVDLNQLAAYLSGSAKASASANEAEGRYYNARDAIKAQMYNTASNAATQGNANALNTAKFTTGLPAQGASEAARGSLLQNVQDVTGNLGNNRANVVNFSGGTRPSALSPEARAAGGDLIKHGQALIADPNSFVPAAQSAAAPGLSPEPSAGFWGQAAGAGGTIAGLLNALNKKPGASGGASPAGGPPNNGNLNDIIKWLKGLGGGSDVVDEEHSPQHQEEAPDQGDTSGVAYGPDGQPLPVGEGASNPEDPNNAIPDWWTAVPNYGGGGGGGGGDNEDTGDYWGDE